MMFDWWVKSSVNCTRENIKKILCTKSANRSNNKKYFNKLYLMASLFKLGPQIKAKSLSTKFCIFSARLRACE